MPAPLLRREGGLSLSAAEPSGVSASSLSPEDKRRLWAHLKANDPERAAFFDDPIVKQLMARGAVPVFPLSVCEAAGIAPSDLHPSP